MPTTNLRTLASRLLAEADLEPADWLDYAGAPGKSTPLPKVGIRSSAELLAYAKLAEDARFLRTVGAVLQKGSSFYWGLAPVRAPAKLLFTRTASEVVAFLMGASVLASDPDSDATLVASWSGGGPTCTVASYLFNDVAPSDTTPRDFVVEALSIAAYIEAYGDPKRRPKPTLGPCRELARLYRRSIWIAQLVQEDDLDTVDDVLATAKNTSPAKLWAKEREGLAEAPHLAAYWLLAHALFGRSEALGEALDLTRASRNPAIADLRARLAPAAKKPEAVEKLFAKRRPDWTKADFAKLRALGERI